MTRLQIRLPVEPSQPPRSAINPIVTVGVFSLAGPAVGYFVSVFATATVFAAREGIGQLLLVHFVVVAFAPLGLMIAYSVAWMPAVATGITLAVLDALAWPARGRLLIATSLGAIYAGLWLETRSVVDPLDQNSPGYETFVAAGAAAALVCAKLSAMLSRLDAKRE